MAGGEIVSVLFTDLIGSTRLLDRLGDDAAERLRQTHFRLLREAVRRRRGHEVKNLGDGLMIVFPSALDALDCAIAIQRKVRRHNRREQSLPLHVRVGVHVGEPMRDEGDYFGTAVNVAKRLCDRAAADQILISQLVVDLVGSRGAFAFRPVGSLRLKGLARPVPAAALDWEAGSADDAEPGVEYRVLGPIDVGRADDDSPVPLASARQRLLLAYLLANAGHVVSPDQLVEVLWGDRLPADPQDALQSHISRLRHRLGHGSPPSRRHMPRTTSTWPGRPSRRCAGRAKLNGFAPSRPKFPTCGPPVLGHFDPAIGPLPLTSRLHSSGSLTGECTPR